MCLPLWVGIAFQKTVIAFGTFAVTFGTFLGEPPIMAGEVAVHDGILFRGHSEEDIISWMKARNDDVHIEHFDDPKCDVKLLILLVEPPVANHTRDIYIYALSKKQSKNGLYLSLIRYTRAAEITMTVDETKAQLVFRTKEGKSVLILPTEGLDY